MKLRSWLERVHDLKCPECRSRAEHRVAMRGKLEVVYSDPTEAEIDAWLDSMRENAE